MASGSSRWPSHSGIANPVKVHKFVSGLAKLHPVQKDPLSSGGQNEERTSAPSCEPPQNVTEIQLDGHDHQQQGLRQAVPQWPSQMGPIASKDTFFCILITNSLRALEKAQADDHKGNRELSIHVDLNKTHKTMSIIDNGVGMATAEFMSVFYSTHGVLSSTFLAAEKIVVRKNNENEEYVCETRGWYTCSTCSRSRLGDTGTNITLFLKDDHLEYLEECTLQGLVDKHFMKLDYPLAIRNYDSSNKWQGELVRPRKCLGWMRMSPIVSRLERYLLKSFPADEVDALKKKIEEKKKSSKGEVSLEEKKKELESLRKVMAKVVGKKVEKVVVSEGRVFPKMACTFSVDPSSKAITLHINPWEPHGILDWLAELVAQDSVKYRKVLRRFVCVLVAMAHGSI